MQSPTENSTSEDTSTPPQGALLDAKPGEAADQHDQAPVRPQRHLKPNWWLSALMLGLLALSTSRALLVHSDPTDFPLDRNITAANKIDRVDKRIATQKLDRTTGQQVFRNQEEAPEFPFISTGAWLISRLGVPLLAAARIFSLLIALLTGWGLYRLGQRLAPSPAVGLLALWVYALLPLSIFLGRGLLPDMLMMAGVVWAMVTAGAEGERKVRRRALGLASWMSVAVLAKLPALFFLPAAALVLMQAGGWRNMRAWIGVITASLAVYLVACFWYGLTPWNPLPGLQAISEKTNNALSTWAVLSGPVALKVTLNRAVLALTLPGLILALWGWTLLQAMPGRRLWLNVWLAQSLLLVLLMVQANTYWAYALIPAASLMIGLALWRLWQMGRWTIAPVTIVLLLGWWLCPSREVLRAYLPTHPEYSQLQEAAARQLQNGKIVYIGETPGDIQFFVRRLGASFRPASYRELESFMATSWIRYVASTRMAGDDAVAELFNHKPVLETQPERFILYDCGELTHLGQPVTTATLGHNANSVELGQHLRVLETRLSSEVVHPDERLTVTLTLAQGAVLSAGPLNLELQFVHQGTSETLPLTPLSGGALFRLWSVPQLQAPNFKRGAVQRMVYQYKLPPHLPAGKYALRLGLLEDRRRRAYLAPGAVTLPVGLTVEPPAQAAALPLAIDPTQGVWQFPLFQSERNWWGRQVDGARLGQGTILWLSPNLKPGRYELRLNVSTRPAGRVGQDYWPILRLQRPGSGQPAIEQPVETNAGVASIIFDWRGAGDLLKLSLANPLVGAPSGAFPLYVDHLTGGMRSVLIKSIELRPAGAAS